jgi:lipopolysaccharide transport system ATP-binding protein
MSDVVLRAEGLGKRYRIGSAAPYRTLRDTVTHAAGAPLRLLRRGFRGAGGETVWALKDVSFEVRQGEVVGVIGRNGAGKSTLLKIVSRITEPSAGWVEVRGRVGSLLEVGTGFHQELTGRENVYMNGAILGMRRAEIRRKFDEIVEFAEIGRFLDTPVKHYSSGMYMRLAFAVAAHLDPEVLLVDEVLAVGDASFQRKCLGKMDEVARAGRTVLFVAHNLGAIGELCHTGILLEQGGIVFRGEVGATIHRYLSSALGRLGAVRTFPRDPAVPLQFLEISARTTGGELSDRFDLNAPVHLRVRYAVNRPVRGSNLCVIVRRNGAPLFCTLDTDHFQARHDEPRVAGEHAYTVEIPARFLKAGVYTVSVDTGRTNTELYELHPEVISFQVEELSEDASLRGYAEGRQGMVVAPVVWREGEG